MLKLIDDLGNVYESTKSKANFKSLDVTHIIFVIGLYG